MTIEIIIGPTLAASEDPRHHPLDIHVCPTEGFQAAIDLQGLVLGQQVELIIIHH